MKNNNTKQRLFEVMGRLDKTFKPRLNEMFDDDYVDPIQFAKQKARGSEDYQKQIQDDAIEYAGGIDNWNTLNDNEKDEIYRLVEPEMNEKYGTPDPLGSHKAKQMNEMPNWGVKKANPAYSHFAVLKNSGKIVNGWDYRSYDQAELREFKKDYFYQDIIDSQINPKDVNIVTGKYLQKKGIDPYDYKNWHKPDVDGTDIYTME